MAQKEIVVSALPVHIITPSSSDYIQMFFNKSDSDRLYGKKTDGSVFLIQGAGGGGIVNSVDVDTINGFSGTIVGTAADPIIQIETTVTGILLGDGTSVSAAAAGDFPILNQSTTGNAATASALSPGRTINGVLFDGTADIVIPISNIAITNDNTTNAVMYPTWVTASAGNLPLKVSDSKTTFNPFTSQYTFGTTITQENFCDPAGLNCVLADFVENHVKNQNANSRWNFGNNSIGTSAMISMIFSTNPGFGEYGVIQLIPSTNSTSQLKPSIMRVASGGGAINGLEVYADNGVVAIGTNNNLANGADGLVVGVVPNQHIGIGTRTPSHKLHIATPGTTAFAPVFIASSGTNFLAVPVSGTIERGDVGYVFQIDSVLIGATTLNAAEKLTIRGNVNSGIYSHTKNLSSGTAAFASTSVLNDVNSFITTQMFSSGFTSSLSAIANGGRVYSSGVGGLNLTAGGATGGQIRFWVTSAEVNCWNMTTAGHLIPGITNTYDVGAVGTTIRNLYVGTQIFTPSITVGVAPTYTISNVTTDRSYDANSTTLDEVADTLGTLVADLRAMGLLL